MNKQRNTGSANILDDHMLSFSCLVKERIAVAIRIRHLSSFRNLSGRGLIKLLLI